MEEDEFAVVGRDWEPEPVDDGEEGVHPAGAEEPPAAHFQPPPEGLGLDGSTPFEGGIQGRLTHAGASRETDRRERDWIVTVDVDQPVQRTEG